MSALSADVTPTSIRKVVGASMIGTTVEWYDFFLYGTAASLVFNKIFFPSYEPLVGTLLAFATYALGFAARPLGGIVFGHFGDKIGRKKMLVFSLALMGGATFAIGLLPTYGTIGIAAPILLVILRMVQGFAVGGEWGGAVLMVAEHGDARRRGFYSSWPQTGVPAGQLIGVLVLTVMASTLSDEAFLSWGWRIPFLLSIILVFIGLWIRTSISESPVFRAAQEQAEREAAENKAPLGIILRQYRREVLIAMGARFAENVSYYVFTLFVITYATQELDLKRTTILNAVLVAAVVHFVSIPLWGALSDKVGRRPLYLLGAVGVGVWAFVFFQLIDTKSFPVMALAISVGLVFHAAMYGPQAAFFSELFGTKARYTGASVGYQLASVFAGSLAPLISVALLARYGSALPVSFYMLGTVFITLIAVLLSKETAHRDLEADMGLVGLAAGERAADTAISGRQ